MFENTMLHESYTGALIAGKGKALNNIRTILERNRFTHADWVRVRFSPGTPWQRCWCVISPPDEKEEKKLRRAEKKKKKSSYERSTVVVKGTVKFYDKKKTSKKTKPIVTIHDAYSAFAIYPQSRPLIEQSTLVKIEGRITVHGKVDTTQEAFVFVLPELHSGVSGVEILLRFLFPVFDAFHLYGRPTRLLADTASVRSMMFAMPSGRRVAYLDNLDVVTLINTDGSHSWSEQEWRKRMKEATARRMNARGTHSHSRASSVADSRYQRSSLPTRNGTSVRFGVPNTGSGLENNHSTDAVFAGGFRHSLAGNGTDASFANGYGNGTPSSGTSIERTVLEDVKEQQSPQLSRAVPHYDGTYDEASTNSSSPSPDRNNLDQLRPNSPPTSMEAPPKFLHGARDMPQHKPRPSSDMRRANSRVSYGTLSQMADMSSKREMVAAAGASAAWNGKKDGQSSDYDQKVNAQQASLAAADTSPASPVSPLPSYVEFKPSTAVSRPTSLEYVAQKPDLSPPKAIHRKPVAQTVPDVETDSATSTSSTSSLGSLRNAIDMDAWNRVTARPRTPSPPPRRIHQSQVPDEDSVYDQGSMASPDYSSSHHSVVSEQSPRSVQRPRMGVKKVVGTQGPEVSDVIIGDGRYQHAEAAPAQTDPNIPQVDFGPTHTLLPTTRRPSTSDTLTLFGHGRNKSDATLVGNERKVATPGRTTPGPGIEGRPAGSPAYEERRRSMLWQPGMTNGHNSPGNRTSVTPEQFVQQRAEAVSPVYGHQRRISSRTISKSPRPISGDWTTYVEQQPARRERPHSRGPSVTLSQLDLSSRLSAREQEHVARATGSSFFNLSNEGNKSQPVLGAGLVGAIDAREREKKAMREGYGGNMVQQAIAQRQHQGPPQYSPPAYGAQSHHRRNESNTLPYNQPAQQQQWSQQPRPQSQQAFYTQESPSSIYPDSAYQPRPSSHQVFYPQGSPSVMYQENPHFR